MPDLSFILADGSEHGFEAPEGVSVMQAATGFGIAGIVAECGGSLQCATCHVVVDPAWADKLPAPSADELAMLECTAAERQPTSRLSCQIRLTAAMNGLVLRVPERQY
ncbi:MAG: 2Fe-2S iron-sulfur cluster binding domain-containing protein [Burkholderiaceae bacterium]|nr:2Fe-2S iron-sulfur cluster binding domain-containing protein [Burkholderiaceae bacterium]